MKQRLFFFIIIASLLMISACGADISVETTPIPPPPELEETDNAGNAATTNGAEMTVTPTFSVESGVENGELSTDPETETEKTPEPTDIPSPTPLAAPISGASVPIQVLRNGDPLPQISRDLLFLADGALKRWSQERRTIEVLISSTAVDRQPLPEPISEHFVGDITDFQVNADGKRAVAVRIRAQELLAEGDRQLPLSQYEILYIDLVSLEQWLLLPQVTALNSISLSPDGMHFAFIAANVDGSTPDLFDAETDDRLFYLPTGGGNAGIVREIAPCLLLCGGPLWNPENNLLSWGDGDGLWLFNLAASTPQKLLENQTTEVNPETWLVYTPHSWARSGRALLLNKGVWEATAHTIFDIPTGNLIDIPDSLISFGPFPSEFGWMPDGRILALRSFGRDGAALHRLQIYRADLETGSIIIDEQIELPDISSQTALLGLQYLEDGRFAFAITSWGETVANEVGLYHLTSFNEVPEKINGLPIPHFPESATLAWSGDGEQAIIHYPYAGGLYYAQARGDGLIDLQNIFGQNPHAFTWLPEIFVP